MDEKVLKYVANKNTTIKNRDETKIPWLIGTLLSGSWVPVYDFQMLIKVGLLISKKRKLFKAELLRNLSRTFRKTMVEN